MDRAAARSKAAKLAPVDYEAAAAVARAIRDAWYRCQAVAYVARYAPVGLVQAFAGESLAAAREASDPYQVVAVAAWPIRALVERDHAVDAHADDLLNRAPAIQHPVCRADALFLLWQALFDGDDSVRQRVMEPLVAACCEAESWKAARTLSSVALMLAKEDRPRALRLAGLLREGRLRRSTIRRIEAGEFDAPREFFWL